MNKLPQKYREASPSSTIRLLSPFAAMKYWNEETWNDWFAYGANIVQLQGPSEFNAAFPPVTVPVHGFSERQLVENLTRRLDSSTIAKMGDGLFHAIHNSSGSDGIIYLSVLINISCYLTQSKPKNAVVSALRRELSPSSISNMRTLAASIALVTSKRLTPEQIYSFLPNIRSVLSHSPACAIQICARLSANNPESYVDHLFELYPRIFELDEKHDHWRFVVNKFVEHVGLIPAYSASIIGDSTLWKKFRYGIEHHRVGMFPAPEFWRNGDIHGGSDKTIEISIMDKVTGEKFKFPIEYETRVRQSLGKRGFDKIEVMTASFTMDNIHNHPPDPKDPTHPTVN